MLEFELYFKLLDNEYYFLSLFLYSLFFRFRLKLKSFNFIIEFFIFNCYFSFKIKLENFFIINIYLNIE